MVPSILNPLLPSSLPSCVVAVQNVPRGNVKPLREEVRSMSVAEGKGTTCSCSPPTQIERQLGNPPQVDEHVDGDYEPEQSQTP